MKFLKIVLLFSLLTACGSDDEAFITPSLLKIYPDEVNTHSTNEVMGIRPLSDGGYAIFTAVSNSGNIPTHISVLKIDANGNLVTKNTITNRAFPLNIIDNGNDNFEFICAPVSSGTPHSVIKISFQSDEIKITTQEFYLDCQLSDCGVALHVIKRRNKYLMLNTGVDKIDNEEFSKIYIHQVDTANLLQQDQISEQNYESSKVFSIATGDYLGLMPLRNLFFIKEANGQILYNAPRAEHIGLRYLNPNKLDIYSSAKFVLSSLHQQSGSQQYSIIFQDKYKELPPYNTYLIQDFNISVQEDSFDIQDEIFFQDALGKIDRGQPVSDLESCEHIYCNQYQKIGNVDVERKTVIRFDNNTGELYLGATTSTGQTMLFHRDVAHRFGSGSPTYELADFLVMNNKIIITGMTTLQVDNRRIQGFSFLTNGKRAPFVMMIPKSEFQ